MIRDDLGDGLRALLGLGEARHDGADGAWEIWLALAAVTVPSLWNAGRSFATPSMVVSAAIALVALTRGACCEALLTGEHHDLV